MFEFKKWYLLEGLVAWASYMILLPLIGTTGLWIMLAAMCTYLFGSLGYLVYQLIRAIRLSAPHDALQQMASVIVGCTWAMIAGSVCAIIQLLAVIHLEWYNSMMVVFVITPITRFIMMRHFQKHGLDSLLMAGFSL